MPRRMPCSSDDHVALTLGPFEASCDQLVINEMVDRGLTCTKILTCKILLTFSIYSSVQASRLSSFSRECRALQRACTISATFGTKIALSGQPDSSSAHNSDQSRGQCTLYPTVEQSSSKSLCVPEDGASNISRISTRIFRGRQEVSYILGKLWCRLTVVPSGRPLVFENVIDRTIGQESTRSSIP